MSLFFFSACSSEGYEEVDKLNYKSYAFHYRNLDSTKVYATKALGLSGDYTDGKAEAFNNLAFVCIARMEYEKAFDYLDSVYMCTDNQLELLIADVQNMRLCQRQSKNKEFYDYNERATQRLKRIEEETSFLSDHLKGRLIYGKSEYAIVRSTYYYYVGLTKFSVESLESIDPSGEIQKDTAQYLNYLYQVGSGGIISENTLEETAQKEFEYLMKCYQMAQRCGYVYWVANSMQSVSEHLFNKDQRDWLIYNNQSAISYLNPFNMPNHLLAGYLAQKSLDMFVEYGDVYQIAGSYRTLASCYWSLGDYTSSLICLENALSSKEVIEQAPELVASIREQLSLAYSAIDDKVNSDINRNKYLDLQENTRQDRFFEARAEMLERTSMQLSVMIGFIIFLIVAVVVLLFVLRRLRLKKGNDTYLDELLQPLRKWERLNDEHVRNLNDRYEEINEILSVSQLHIEKDKKRNIDNRAKIFLINSVTPYIDRIINEVRRIDKADEDEEKRNERYAYMTELTDKITEYNDVLTHWIQLQQGQLSLHIESFSLKETFDILSKAKMSFHLKGIDLEVMPTDAVVKADKILTLFMLNTLADNARKFTDKGGKVCVKATGTDDYVEISVEDNGKGMSKEELSGIFDHKIYNGHGFGLMNCRGIMDKYRKISQIFNVCGLFAESEKGSGSRFFFRLPHGIVRSAIMFMTILGASLSIYADKASGTSGNVKTAASAFLAKADAYADSAYYSNIKGTYSKTLAFADSSRIYLNLHYKSLNPDGKRLMLNASPNGDMPAEIRWYHDNVKTDYDIILDIRNESAIAALALHDWNLYNYNNKVYTQLFKEMSADSSLPEYCKAMQRSSSDKAVAVVVLVLLLITIVVVYYLVYYRHVLYFRFCVEHVNGINTILLSDSSNEEKLKSISSVESYKYPEALKNIVSQIQDALRRSIVLNEKRTLNIELAEDELRRARYEDEKLYVSNNVIDNCLSTFKHETMYYPSRIRQLVNSPERNIKAIREVVEYYKELYSILSEQAHRQATAITFECKPVDMSAVCDTSERVMGDRVSIMYLFEILQKQFGKDNISISASVKDNKYVVFDVHCPNMKLDEEQCLGMFTPSVGNIPFLVCRQIVRENSESTNLHGCGIVAEPSGNGIVVHVTLARAMS